MTAPIAILLEKIGQGVTNYGLIASSTIGPFFMLCSLTFKTLITKGHLRIIDAHGKTHDFGRPDNQPSATMRLHDPRLHSRLFYNPRLYVGEAWMNGTLTVENGSLRNLLKLFAMNMGGESGNASFLMKLHEKLGTFLSAWQQYNPLNKAKENVAHHYDLGNAFYELFLDRDMQYSCAYFASEHDSLEEAQLNKKSHIAAKLQIQPGMQVLDIGSGWGGLAFYLARETGAHVTGLTLSEEQLKKARARALEAGLESQVQFRLRDYRDEPGTYDRVVSVGMFEHVGKPHYSEFFNSVKRLLKRDGVALLHSIGRMEGPGATNAWLKKYIFPGGYAPALSEVVPQVEKKGLWLTDMEILRTHYALTIEQWHRRFEANRARIAAMYDDRFCRMWEFYLLAVEMEFRYVSSMVFQMQLTRKPDTLPITRDYMQECERALSSQKLPSPKRYAMH